MKKILKYISGMAVTMMLLPAMACCSDDVYELTGGEDGDGEFTVTVGVNIPDMELSKSRAFGEEIAEPQKATIKFLAFDENHLLTNVYEGEYAGVGEHNQVYYTVTMKETDQKRIFHVLVNHNGLNIADIPYGTESDIFNNKIMVVDKGTDVYWDKFELAKVTKELMSSQLKHLDLIRNFCKVTLNFAEAVKDKLTDVEWAMMTTPTLGSVAPYIDGQEFAEYFDSESSNKENHAVTASYNDLYKQKYYGHIPRNSTNADKFYDLVGNEDVSKLEWVSSDTPLYTFENEGSSGSSLWQQTRVFIRGYYVDDKGNKDAEKTYYRVALVDPSRNYEPLNLLRNLLYDISINRITDRGFETAIEAYTRAAGNNISGSTVTTNYPNVTSGTAALRVEYMKKYILTPEPFKMLYRYVPNISNMTNGIYNAINALVELQETSAAEGVFEATTLPNPITLDNFALKSYEFATADSAGTNNYRAITFTPNIARTDGMEVSSTVRVAVTDPDHKELYRNVEFILRPRYLMRGEVDGTTTYDGSRLKITKDEGTEDCYTCTVEIPASLPTELFPLTFTFETYPSCTYPNVAKSIMVANSTDASIFDPTLTQYFHYHRTVSRDAYGTILDEHGAGGFVEKNGYKQITFFFKINPTVLDLSGTNNQIRFGVYCNMFSPTPYDDVAKTTASFVESVYTYDADAQTLTLVE